MEGKYFAYPCFVMFWNIVQSSEWPSKPVLGPLKTIDGCRDCLVGFDNAGSSVWCDVDAVDVDVYNVTIKAGDEALDIYEDENQNGRYRTDIELESVTHHMAKLTCSVHYNTTQETLTAETDIYVCVETRRPPSLYDIPERLREGGDTPHIVCLIENIRPPANNITMWIGGNVVEGLEPDHDFDNSTSLYNSSVVLTYFQRNWNMRNITCCQYNNKSCSDPKTVDYIFPPNNVTLHVKKHSDVARQCYIMEARCYISHANPLCNATWLTTKGIIASQKSDKLEHHPEDGSVTSIYSAMIHVNMSVTEVTITCTPECGSPNFASLLGKSMSIRYSPATTTDTGNEDSSVNVALFAGVGGGIGAFVVICVLAIVIYKCKTTKDTDLKPIDNIPRRDSEEMQDHLQQPEPPDNKEGEQEKQLAYIDVEFDTSGVPSCSTHINRRESQVDYVAIDMIKTADMATQEGPVHDEAEIYINHDQ